MIMKIVAGLIAIVLMVAYLVPPAIKLKDLALSIVIVIGVALMLLDLWESLWERE
jgi:hypothetical protein